MKRPFRFVPHILAAIGLFGAGWQTGYFVSRRHLQTAHGIVHSLRLGSHSEIATAQLYSANVTEAQILSYKHLLQEQRANTAAGNDVWGNKNSRNTDESLTLARIAILEERLGNRSAAEEYQRAALLAIGAKWPADWAKLRGAVAMLDTNHLRRNPQPNWQITNMYVESAGIASAVTEAP